MAEHHVGAPGGGFEGLRVRVVGHAAGSADHHIGETVAVDVAGRADRESCEAERLLADQHEAVVAVQRRQIDGGAELAVGSEDDVGGSSAIHRSLVVTVGCPDDDVVQAVTVDVAGRTDGDTGIGHRMGTFDDHPCRAVQGREIQAGLEAAAVAEYQIGLAGFVAGTRIGARRTNQEVVVAVTVDVAGRTDGKTGVIVHVRPLEDKPVTAVEGRQVEGPRERIRTPEDHVSCAGIGVATGIGVGTDDQVVQAVAVDIPGRTDRDTGLVVHGDTMDGEARVSVEGRGVDAGGETAGLAEHDVGFAAVGDARRITVWRTDHQVVESVAIDVPGTTHRRPQ